MYRLIYIMGLLIRQFFLPNPFEVLWPEYAVILNWLFGGLLLLVAYLLTGLIYRKGDGAAIGSIIFNIIYLVLSFILLGLFKVIMFCMENPTIILVIVCVVLFVSIMIILVTKCRGKARIHQKNKQE